MSQRLVTFKDIQDAIMEALGVQRDDANARNKVKRFINMAYVDEVVPFKQWTWLRKSTSAVHKAYYNVGTASVTPSSTTVTLSTAPNATVGSFKNYKFSVEGSNKVYTVSAHTAESTTVTLSGAYQEALNATATYKLWRDVVDLPTDAKETVSVWHAERPRPLDGVGPHGLRKLETAAPKAEGFPHSFNVTDYFDPSPDDAETESDRYRQIRIYPAITLNPVTINVDYVTEAVELDDDTDEPLMPISDRIVLFYKAGAMAWSIINRNEEMHDRWEAKYADKISRMAGDRDDGFDTPSFTPKSGYVNSIRKSGLKRRTISMASGGGGQTSVALPTYLSDVQIDGATVIDDITVEDGVLIDGRDISEDGDILDNLVGSTQVNIPNSSSNEVMLSLAIADYDVAHVHYSIKRGTVKQTGILTLTSDGTDVAWSDGSGAQTSSTGVTLSADYVSGNMRVLATSTNTGTAATFTYQVRKWLS